MSYSLINPELDKASLADAFQRDGKVRVADVLRSNFAERIYQCLSS